MEWIKIRPRLLKHRGKLIEPEVIDVLPEYEGQGFGSLIMDRLEEAIFDEYEYCDLDASLPAAIFYEHRGYRTVEHRKHDIGDGEVMIYEIMRKEKI